MLRLSHHGVDGLPGDEDGEVEEEQEGDHQHQLVILNHLQSVSLAVTPVSRLLGNLF